MSIVSVGQSSIKCVLMRGGTSKGLYFLDHDLPPAGPIRDRLLLRLMGSPDKLQLDGLGGSRPITSKVVILSVSKRDDADIDYTFAQVGIREAIVDYRSNCGNLSAGVGPFAVDEGLVPVTEGGTQVRIYNTNTGKLLIADVPVAGGRAAVSGDFEMPGVPGTGAEIRMNWAHTIGTINGKLLPTARAIDQIEMEDGSVVPVTICDVANPCVWVRAESFGLTGSESVERINGDRALLDRLEEIRGKTAQMVGFCSDWRDAKRVEPAMPMVGMVAPPGDYVTVNGAQIAAELMDLRVRLIFMDQMHETISGTSSICLAAASRIPDSIVYNITHRSEGLLRIGHPSGVTTTRVVDRAVPNFPFVEYDDLGFSRTARRLMDANAYYPSALFSED
ncbi:PrpF domain-containing protein [Pseudomonas tolaasii]